MSEFLETLRGISPILVCLLVCAAKIIEITIQSLKTCMMVKGQRRGAWFYRMHHLGFGHLYPHRHPGR